MARGPASEMSEESFHAWAALIGLPADEHLSELRGEVLALLRRLAPVHDIDVSDVPIEQVAVWPGGTA